MKRWLILLTFALLVIPSARSVNAQGLLYTVTSTGDGDLVGTDAVCDDGFGECTLRAAIEASNLHPGTDGIDFAIPNSGSGPSIIFLSKALPDLSESVGITGPGVDLLFVERNGGGDYRIFNVVTSGVVSISGMTITSGQAPTGAAGGGIQNLNDAIVSISGTDIIANSADNGGGISNTSDGTVNLTNSRLISNSAASGNGGGIANLGSGIVNVTASTLSNFAPAGGGGGICNAGSGSVNLSESALINNQANFGAGLACLSGLVIISNSTFSNNQSALFGGGIFCGVDGTTFVLNSTISGNSAPADGGGIAINGSGSVHVKSSLIALNTATGSFGADLKGAFSSSGFNLIGNTAGGTGFDEPTDQTGTLASPLDPKLDPNGPQDNGGATRTIALLFDSPAIDQGEADGPTTDQRGTGFVRTFDNPAILNATGGNGTDIGAFEVQTPAPTPTPTPTPVPTTLGNISTRLRVETGDNVLIGGFIITGSQPKKVLIRAMGPSLSLAGKLADPSLELFDSSGQSIASNDNWMDAPNRQEIIDSTIPPPSDLESAILMTLEPAAYTAIMRGVNNTTGIGLVEAYDLDNTVDSELANISTRGLVQTGDNVMIGGLIVLGTDAQTVLVRAIGPSLPLGGTLADPTLELHDSNGVLLTLNDNWRDTQETEINATMIAPTNDAESAILQTLAPAAYTAIVRGKNGTTGVALVEAYQLDN